MGDTIRDHITTKLGALWLLLRGKRGAARVLWRWMANRPTERDLVKARETLRRPEVQRELARLSQESDQ